METLKQIATIVATLDRDVADELLDHLDPDDADVIRGAIMKVVQLDDHDARSAIESFFESESGAVHEPTPTDANKHAAETDALDRLLEQATNDLLSSLLQHELPQTSAVILSRLPASRASEIVSTLPSKSQPDILQRIVGLDDASIQNTSFMQAEFERWLRQEIQAGTQRVELISRMANVVESASSTAQNRILKNVAAFDSNMAQQLRDQFGLDLEVVGTEG